VLIWAHTNSVDEVKEAVLNFMVQNRHSICLQNEWEMLTVMHPHLCVLATRRMMAEFPATKKTNEINSENQNSEFFIPDFF
jgi:hypothetical protein